MISEDLYAAGSFQRLTLEFRVVIHSRNASISDYAGHGASYVAGSSLNDNLASLDLATGTCNRKISVSGQHRAELAYVARSYHPATHIE
jgi:hypothetical protein